MIWKIDSEKTDTQMDEINNLVEITENITTVSDQYLEHNKSNILNIDFPKLNEINSHTKGWSIVENTNINYPFVQYTDNNYYLNHSFDKTNNKAGWVFLDYRNNINNLSKNTIIYAHSRLDKTMFGSLKDALKKEWLKNKENHIIKIITPDTTTLWQVFSLYHIPTTNDYIRVKFKSDDEFNDWIYVLTSRSVYDFDIQINSNDKILTLSTCYKNNEKLVLHAKLIKTETN